jgi:hypothetical protein
VLYPAELRAPTVQGYGTLRFRSVHRCGDGMRPIYRGGMDRAPEVNVPTDVDVPTDAGGDPACWAALLCPACDAVVEDRSLLACPQCGERYPDDADGE